jgi:hypothetical protein
MSVTLYIQGHGEEDVQISQGIEGVRLLSFAGSAGVLGSMKKCTNGEMVDIVTLKFLQQMYKTDTTLETQEMLFDDILPDSLKDIYENFCNINFVGGGFKKTYPKTERTYFFAPNEHEDCRICKGQINDITGKISHRCLPIRDANSKYCPEYGITVVSSSFEEDHSFTLASDNSSKDVNLHLSLSAKNYWKNKAKKNSTNQKSLEFIDKLFEKLFSREKKPKAYLTELIRLFHLMGFTRIFIIDPTCRTLARYNEPTGDYNASKAVKSLRRFALSVIESQKPRTNSIPNFSYSASKYNTNTTSDPDSDKGIFERCLGDYCPGFLKNSRKTKARGIRVKNPKKNKTLKNGNKKTKIK